MTTRSTSKYLQSCKSIWLLLELLSESFATFRSYDPCLPESPNELAHFRASTNELQLQWHLRKLPGFFSDMRYRGKQDDTCSAIFYRGVNMYTLPETNIAPENWWLKEYFPFAMAYFQWLCEFQGVYKLYMHRHWCWLLVRLTWNSPLTDLYHPFTPFAPSFWTCNHKNTDGNRILRIQNATKKCRPRCYRLALLMRA